MLRNELKVIGLGLLVAIAGACGDPGVGDEDLEDPIVLPPVEDDPVVPDPFEEDPVPPPFDDDLIAPFDNDSAANPAVDAFLSITGQREIEYTDQISAEEGDLEDFVQFELPNNSNPNQRISVSLDCDVYGDENVTARVDLFDVDGNDPTRITGGPIDCNEGEFFVTVQNDLVQSARIRFFGVPEVQTLVEYTFIVDAF